MHICRHIQTTKRTLQGHGSYIRRFKLEMNANSEMIQIHKIVNIVKNNNVCNLRGMKSCAEYNAHAKTHLYSTIRRILSTNYIEGIKKDLVCG